MKGARSPKKETDCSSASWSQRERSGTSPCLTWAPSDVQNRVPGWCSLHSKQQGCLSTYARFLSPECCPEATRLPKHLLLLLRITDLQPWFPHCVISASYTWAQKKKRCDALVQPAWVSSLYRTAKGRLSWCLHTPFIFMSPPIVLPHKVFGSGHSCQEIMYEDGKEETKIKMGRKKREGKRAEMSRTRTVP